MERAGKHLTVHAPWTAPRTSQLPTTAGHWNLGTLLRSCATYASVWRPPDGLSAIALNAPLSGCATMTAVMSATDALRRDRVMSSHDDNQIKYSNRHFFQLRKLTFTLSFFSYSPAGVSEWKEKYYEAADMLQEARNELDEFQRSSKELEDELERELERTEKTQDELRAKAAKAEAERDEWKVRNQPHFYSVSVASP